MKTRYLIRLDDACPYMDRSKWHRMEVLLDKYCIKPLVAIIPNCQDPALIDKYNHIDDFSSIVSRWQGKEWTLGLHGYSHKYISSNKGINPVNDKSEFAGVELSIQKKKIKEGVKLFEKFGIESNIFVAPSHTFDLNTIKALKEESNIRIISDTVASDIYSKYGMTFIPQQSGRCRYLPVRTATFCYHPNTMRHEDFKCLESFIEKEHDHFVSFDQVVSNYCERNLRLYDHLLRAMYYLVDHIRGL